MLDQNISKYKRKYYLNKLLRGVIFSFSLLLVSFLFVTAIEYFGNFDTPLRATLFYSFLITAITSLGVWVFEPLSRLLMPNRQLSDSDAAQRIGNHFPQVKDRLLNTLQLLKAEGSTDLLKASINQKSAELEKYQFDEAIDLSYNKKYLRYLLIPLLIILAVGLYSQDFFTQSTTRLIQYDRKFVPQAPFSFNIEETELSAFRGEDFMLKLDIDGNQVPAQVTIMAADGRRLRMLSEKAGAYSYEFKNIQRETEFFFEASGFHSKTYTLKVLDRPNLRGFSAFLDYPSYVGKEDERLDNTGNLIVPEGTNITWQFQSLATEELAVKFTKQEESIKAQAQGESTFGLSYKALDSDNYEVRLKNEYSNNKETISYYLNVVKDEKPSISLRQVQDTVLYDYLLFGGNIGDDYGITGLNLRYQVVEEGAQPKSAFKTVKIPFNRDLISQSFFYKVALKDMDLEQGQYVSYYVEVWDNDGVNGRKKSQTSLFQFKFPTKSELNEKIAEATENTENKLEEVLKESKDFKKELEELENRLKGKKKLSWQDKKALEELMKKRQQLEKKVSQMQQSNQELQEKFQKFNEPNPQLAEKAQQLQQLMDEVLDEETKQMYQELQELMEENMMDEDLLEQLEKLNNKEETMEMELERSLELFKKLKFDMKAEQLSKDLEKLGKKQDELAKETEEKAKELGDTGEDSEEEGKEEAEKEASETDTEAEKQDADKQDDKPTSEEQKQQQELNKAFEELEKEMQELEKMNEDLQNPRQEMKDFDKDMKDIDQEMKKSEEQLGQQQQKKASDSQKKAAEKMQELAQQMQQMQQSAEMQQLTEDYDALRQILENLIKLSFDQESLMKEFRTIRRGNPKFVQLGQEQLKLKSDTRIIEDSLVALSQRVFQIESFVTRELSAMNNYMDESLEVIRQRPPDVGPATAKEQQLTMTAVNNLALLLSDILEQMQQSMSSGMGGQQMNEKPSNSPSMSELQKQLNQQIQSLKKSGKSGRQLSEELAKLAAQQEMIRRALESAQKGQKPGGGSGGSGGGQGELGPDGKPMGKDGENGKGGELGKEGRNGEGGQSPLERLMEQTEEDLVNKRITQETINRQKEIMTRLLQSEKAMRERELDKKREAETAKQKPQRRSPDAFSEYLKQKEQQIELLKTIPASLRPYYKQAVNEYFKKVGP